MRMFGMNSLLRLLTIGVFTATLQAIPVGVYADDHNDTPNDVYLDQVVSVMRSHVASMRMILEHEDLKYHDNMVRHAEAFERAFGMVGPMEWHVAEAYSHAQKSDAGEKLSKKQFDELGEETRVAVHQVKRSAVRYMRDKKKNLMRKSINGMIKSCGACHSKLPKGTVPSVWKGMKE